MEDIFLACSGWIADGMPGNRLRWTLPEGVRITKLVVQRAPLEVSPVDKQKAAALPPEFRVDPTTDLGWWEPLPDVELDDGYPHQGWTLPGPVQGLRFRYAGPRTTCILRAEPEGRQVATRVLTPGEAVVLRAAQLGQVVFRTPALSCTEIATLNLRADRGLAWETIASVRTDPRVPDSLAAAVTRLPSGALPADAGAGTDWWSTLAELAAGVVPTGDPDDRRLPTPEQRFALARASRFWLAVLTGAGFVDGPRSVPPAIDDVIKTALLPAPPRSGFHDDVAGRAAGCGR
jgi:hypothetical protein